jgi:hypothetical protein
VGRRVGRRVKTTYYVTLPDGHVVQRTTARRYSHAVAVRPTFTEKQENHAYECAHHHGRWGVVGFCGSPALADKLVHKERRYYESIGARVEVEILETRGEP